MKPLQWPVLIVSLFHLAAETQVALALRKSHSVSIEANFHTISSGLQLFVSWMSHSSGSSVASLHLSGILLVLLSLLQLTAAIKLVLPPGKTECVLESVDEDHFLVSLSLKKMVTFECLAQFHSASPLP